MVKMRLEGKTQKIIREMTRQGKVTILTHDPLATKRYRTTAERIIKESRQKQRASRGYIRLVESGMINYP